MKNYRLLKKGEIIWMEDEIKCSDGTWDILPKCIVHGTPYNGKEPLFRRAEVPPTVTFTPELAIGTEFWYMRNNQICLGLVSAYHVYVTSYTNPEESWYWQLFSRWFGGKQKDTWKFSFTYEVKLDGLIMNMTIDKQRDGWHLFRDTKIYFSKEECLE